MDRGNFLIFFFYYRGITGLLYVISLQFIGFSLNKHSIEICNIRGKVLLGWPNFIGGGGVPLIWVMPKCKQFFLCVCSLSQDFTSSLTMGGHKGGGLKKWCKKKNVQRVRGPVAGGCGLARRAP